MKLTKEQYQALPEYLQKACSDNGDGTYTLNTGEDVGALKRAKEHEAEKRKEEVKKRKAAEERLKELEDQQQASSDEAKKKAGDIEALETSYKNKLDKVTSEKDEVISTLKGQISGLLIDNVAQSVADSISVSPKLMLPFIKERLTVDLDGDKPTTRILDKDGQISALTIDELKSEFLENKDFERVLIASKASGGKTSDAEPDSSAKGFSTGGGESQQSLTDLSDEDLAKRITSLREEQKQ